MLENGLVYSSRQPERKLSYGQMAAAIQQKNQVELIRTVTYQSPANPGSYASNFVEVAVDTFTGFVKILDVVLYMILAGPSTGASWKDRFTAECKWD